VSAIAPRHKVGDFVRIAHSSDMGAFAGTRARVVAKVRDMDMIIPRTVIAYVLDAQDGTRFTLGKNFLHTLPEKFQCYTGEVTDAE